MDWLDRSFILWLIIATMMSIGARGKYGKGAGTTTFCLIMGYWFVMAIIFPLFGHYGELIRDVISVVIGMLFMIEIIKSGFRR